MKKIILIGSGGSGKSTLARQLGNKLDMGVGCEERLDIDFLKWIWNFPKTKRLDVLERLERSPSEKQIVILKSPKQIRSFLKKYDLFRISFCDGVNKQKNELIKLS